MLPTAMTSVRLLRATHQMGATGVEHFRKRAFTAEWSRSGSRCQNVPRMSVQLSSRCVEQSVGGMMLLLLMMMMEKKHLDSRSPSSFRHRKLREG